MNNISIVGSLSNEGLCSHATEESASAILLAASTEVTASDNVLHEQEERDGSDFLESSEEAKDRRQLVSMPLAECAMESAAGSLTDYQGELPSLVFDPNSAKGKETATISAASMNIDSEAGQISVKRDEGDPGSSGLEHSPPLDAAWMPGARVAQTNSSGLEPLQQSEQLSDRRETHVIPLPKSEEGGDKMITQETSRKAGFLEVGHEELAVMKLGGQNTDGADSLVTEKETLIPNDPTTGGSDIEKYGAVADGLHFVVSSAATDECDKDVATSKVDEPCQVFPEMSFVAFTAPSEACNKDATTSKVDEPSQVFPKKNKEQSASFPVVPNLSVNTPDLSLLPTAKEDTRDFQSKNECPGKAINKEPTTPLPVTGKENHSVGFLVTSEPSRVSFLPVEYVEEKTSQHRAVHAGSNKIMKAECENRENLANITKKDSESDQRFSLEGRTTDFTSDSKLPELIKKENIVPEENKDISLGGVGSHESLALTNPVIPEEVNNFQEAVQTADINKRQDTAGVSWNDNLNSLLNILKSDASEKALGGNISSEYNLNVPKGDSAELSLGSKPEKTATHERQGNSSCLPVEAVHLQGAKHPESYDFLNLSAENSLPACKIAEMVCLADVPGSLLVQSENNPVKQNKQDSPREDPTVKNIVWGNEGKVVHELSTGGSLTFEGKLSSLEHQGIHEWTGIAECVTSEKTKIQKDASPLEREKQATSDDASNVPMPVAELSTAMDIKESHENGQEGYRTEMKGQANDTALVQETESKLDSPHQLQQKQVTEDNYQNMKEACSGSPILSASIMDSGTQELKFISEDLHNRSTREHDYPSKSYDSEMSIETLQTKDDQHTKAVLVPSSQAEQEESPESLVSVCSNQQHISSSELKNDNSSTVTRPDEQEFDGVYPQKEHSLILNECSDQHEQFESEIKVVDIPAESQIILCDLEMKANVLLPSISKTLEDTVQDSSLQTLKEGESCLSKKALIQIKQDDSNTMTSDSLHEEASLDDACIKESVINEQLGVLCGMAGDSGKSNTGLMECIPATQNTDIAKAVTETLPTDFKTTHADADAERNRTDHNLLSNQTELAEERSDPEIEENLSLTDAIIMNDEYKKKSFEKDLTFLADEMAEAQQYHPLVLREPTEMPSSNTLYKTDSIQKTEFLPGGSEGEITVLSTSAFPCEQHMANQQLAGSLNDGIVGELQKQELEVAAYQNVSGAGSDLHIAAADATREDNSAEKSSTDPGYSRVLNLDSIISEAAPGEQSVIPEQDFQAEESTESTGTLQSSTETGQFEGSLSPFNFKKLRTEISAIRTKGAKSDVSFKAQQCDSSVESLFSFSSLEEKLPSLSSLGKQAGSNERAAANITYEDDKQKKGVENTQIAEKGQCASIGNFPTPKPETVFPTQSSQPDVQISRAFGTGFFDFREHISKIFEKTVQSALKAELQHLSDENVASDNESPIVKESPEFKQVLEARDGNSGNGKLECDQKTGGDMLLSESETSNGATQEKIAQQVNQFLINAQDSREEKVEYCLSDISHLATLPNLDCELDGSKMSNKKMKTDESEQVSPMSSYNGANLISLETEKPQLVNDFSPRTVNQLPSPDGNLPIMTAVSSEVISRSDFASSTPAEEGDLISACNAKPGLSEEEPIMEHYGNLCYHLMPSKDDKNEESILNSGNVSPLPFLLDVLCERKEQAEQSRTLPDKNEKKSIDTNLLNENSHQDKGFTMPDALGNSKHPQLSQEQGQGTEMQRLIDYFKNEVHLDDGSPSNCKPDAEEANNIKLSTAENEEHISVDTPKKGIKEILFTEDSDSALQPSICDQGSDAEKHSETIHRMEQNVCFKSTDAIVASANQNGEKNWTQECFLQNIQGKKSAASPTELEQNLPSEHPSMAAEGLPAERYLFKMNCKRIVPVY